MALGAKPSGMAVPILRYGPRPRRLGSVNRVGGSLRSGKVISGFLFGVGETDLTIVTSIFVLLLMVGLLATYLPARRATLTSPAVVLNGD